MDLNTIMGIAAGAVTVVGGAYAIIRKYTLAKAIQQEEYRESILRKAKEEADKIKDGLEDRINKVEAEIKSQKEGVAKDFAFMKSSYQSEVKTLGDKIEDLRTQLNNQHSDLIALLTKLVETK